jgi:hypothetical protein
VSCRLTPRGAAGIAVSAFALVAAGGWWTPVFAQRTPDSRVAVSVGAAAQLTATSFSQSITFEQYSEAGSLSAAYSFRPNPVVDAGVTVRVWGRLGIGVSGSYAAESATAQVNASVPNPLVFGQPRQVDGPAGVSHTELGVHIQAVYWVEPTPRTEIVVSGGPSVFHVNQDFVSDVTYTQSYPYTIATYQGAAVIRERQTVNGANIGGEVGWKLAPHVNLSAGLRFTHATANFSDTNATSVAIGGLHVGGGVRFLF